MDPFDRMFNRNLRLSFAMMLLELVAIGIGAYVWQTYEPVSGIVAFFVTFIVCGAVIGTLSVRNMFNAAESVFNEDPDNPLLAPPSVTKRDAF